MDNSQSDNLLRTQGDGMEYSSTSHPESKSKRKETLGDKLIYRQPQTTCFLRPVKPNGKITNLVPKYVPREKKNISYFTKPREPKFVPYEPYKGSVEPIIRRKKETKKIQKISKNNVDIQDLVTQMSELTSAEIHSSKSEAIESDVLISKTQWEKEKLDFENDIKNLRETNTHLENQLKFQAQVNRELKTLLVAAVGEDLESRVQHLTEDKLALARELLKSANHLTSHQEHTEWLSGQCEVWRSKFLASSLMVEELSHWKSALTKKLNEIKDIVKRLLDERNRVRDISLKSFNSLSSVSEHIHINKSLNNPEIQLKSTNILELSMANATLSETIEKHFLKDLPEPRKHRVADAVIKNAHTATENAAMYIVKTPITIQEKDLLCNAVMGAATAVGRGQLFLQHPSKNATCCAHCQGEIKNL